MSAAWSLEEILMELDGAGLIITDQDLLLETLDILGFDPKIEVQMKSSEEDQ